jgi:hypothetical protein
MEQKLFQKNNREQIQQEKFRQEVVRFLEKAFDFEKDKNERSKHFLRVANSFIKAGILNEEKFNKELEEYNDIENKNEFIDKMLLSLEPILEANKKDPRLFEKIRADSFVEQGKFIKLNEVLSYGISKDSAHIHLAPSKELLREIGKEGYLNLILDGFKKLAKVVENNDKILKITATSPVVLDNPNRMEELGFISMGPISEERRNKHWKGDERKVGEAEMSRETLLEKYL